ncbi:conserved hypothetical protein [Flavobacterium sp. 9AF]|uniref:hypothetical protein n=1 Tax=Flavobacterium sp. 9AF TaxID=2653142 RepID=UPI0012F3CCB7|nr:hypothetical protein [Flavobacterium sp. 9AF]VXB07617.1 conserved hypothetical protein [Flavobacterium sp. 9AF]
MKKTIVLLSMLTVLACKKNEEKKDEPGIMDAVEGVSNLNKAGDALKDFEKQQEKLKAMTPISNDVLKNVLTEELGGLKRAHFNAGDASMMGLATADAKYTNEESGKEVAVSIMDGAGESGSSIISLTVMALSMNVESINDTETKKTETINGIKCLTEDDTNPEYIKSSITFIYKDRYQVALRGTKINLDELKSYMKNLDLSKLD